LFPGRLYSRLPAAQTGDCGGAPDTDPNAHYDAHDDANPNAESDAQRNCHTG
jgi:hypothetical protein